eukprot:Opistho-2@30450
MPLPVRDFTWDQTDAEVHVTVPLKGVKPAKADVFATDCYVKINYPPYLFEVDLYSEIEEPQSVATFDDGCVKLRLVKQQIVAWPQLHADGEKDVTHKRREASVDAQRACLQEIERRRTDEKNKTDREMVAQQMEVERRDRERIEGLKRDEADAAALDVLRWQSAVDANGNLIEYVPGDGADDVDDDGTDSDDEPSPSDAPRLEKKAAPRMDAQGDKAAGAPVTTPAPVTSSRDEQSVHAVPQSKAIFDDDADANGRGKGRDVTSAVKHAVPRSPAEAARMAAAATAGGASAAPYAQRATAAQPPKPAEKTIPAPRASGTITVSFTPRTFPTAARESRLSEEEEWLNQIKARQSRVHPGVDGGGESAGASTDVPQSSSFESAATSSGGTSTSLPTVASHATQSIDERSAQWLKDKGDAFYRNGNFQSAVEAYTEAIKLDDGLPAIHSNRAACYLRLGSYALCVEDCTSALSLLPDSMPVNRVSRARAYARRYAAHTSLGNLVAAAADCEAAHRLDADNEDILRDLEKLRAELLRMQ